MKTTALVATIIVSTISASFALTTADIQPAALAGKTLNFTIGEGEKPFPIQGTFAATFAQTGSGLKITKGTGDTFSLSTTYTAKFDGDDLVTFVTVKDFIKGQAPAEFTLYIDRDGSARYYAYIRDSTVGHSSGTFTISLPKGPEISIKLGTQELVAGKSTALLGNAKIGKSSKGAVFTISNVGDATLKKLSVSISGKNKKDFQITKISKKTLDAGKSATLKVTFKPSSAGKKVAVMTIKSSDSDEGSFVIKLKGQGQKTK